MNVTKRKYISPDLRISTPRCRHYQTRFYSAGCCVPILPSIGCCHCTITTASCKYLLTLQCQSKLSDMAKKYVAFGGRSGYPLPSSSGASFSISSSSYASYLSSVSNESFSSSSSLPHFSHLYASEPLPPRTVS